ncbi:MAG: alpha/beta hydrolase [Bacteroidaceae bacterium]|nr:alpha/beta hydrolase [Bacteroidaceae bacterium]
MSVRRKACYIALMAWALFVSGCSTGRMICGFALKPGAIMQSLENTRSGMDRRFPGVMEWYDSLRNEGVFRDTMIVKEGGVRLHAVYAGCENAGGTAIIIHGYISNHISMLHLARMYRDSIGFNVLLPDLQYHGLSGGRYAQMGWNDRLDIKRWVAVAHELWNDDFMLVCGVSMGAATTMMLSGEPDLPDYLRAFVEDCGYTSVWDELEDIRSRTSFTEKNLEKASEFCARKYGWDFREASSVNQVAKCDRPMLFIHGSSDDVVPSRFVYECYEAKTLGYKEIWVAPNTVKHTYSFKDHPDEYLAHVRGFIEKARHFHQ